jgi:hypothetical protein
MQWKSTHYVCKRGEHHHVCKGGAEESRSINIQYLRVKEDKVIKYSATEGEEG